MRHRLEKGIVSVALGVSMAFGMCPAAAIAEEATDQVAAESQQEATGEQESSSQEQETLDTQTEGDETGPQADTQTHDGITFEAWTATDSLPTTAGSYYLTADVTLSDTWNAPVGETNLCLNGKTIKKDAGAGKSAIKVGLTAKLDLYDCAGAGVIQPGEGAVETGVIVENAGTFKMHAGTIKGFGMGVYVDTSVFDMAGGAITENGGDEGIGGGVYFAAEGISIFNLSGGEITGNKAGTGAGVYLSSNTTLTLSGAPKVTGNTAAGVARNVCFAQGDALTAKMAVTKLETGASVGVTKANESGEVDTSAFTIGYGLTQGDTDPSAFFTSDNADYVVSQMSLEDAKEAHLAKGYNVKVAEGIEHGSVTTSKAKAAEGDLVAISTSADAGYKLDTLTVTDAEGKEVVITDGAFTMPAGEVTVNATFKVYGVCIVTFDANGGTGSMTPFEAVSGETTTLPTNTFVRSGYIFVNWNTEPDGTGTKISNGAKVQVTSNVTLYAQWAKSSTANTGTASTAKSATSTSTTLAKTADPTSIVAIATTVVAGAGVVVAGVRNKRSR